MARSPFGRLRIAQRLQFLLERQFVRGAAFQLLVVAGLIGVISIVGGALVLPVAEEAGHFGEAVWWAFLRLTDPGYLGDDEGVWRRIVSTALTVSGYVVFLGALVAILTQSLNSRMRRLESGLTPVATRNHLVVLGWSSRTLPVVAEILQSEGRLKRFLALRHVSRLQLVILCDEVTAWHAQALRDDPAIGARERHIVLRSGSPLVVDDLERVDCLNAAAVILPSAGGGGALSADMGTIKALLSLSSHPRAVAGRLPYVVAEIQDQRKVTVALRAYRGPLEIVSGNGVISRLMAQNLRNPGLSRVYRELLSHQLGCGIYVREADGMAGTTMARARLCYPSAVLCGALRARGEELVPHLNPPGDFVIEAGDRLVFVAPDYGSTEAVRRGVEAGPEAQPDLPPVGASAAKQRRRVLVLGWNSKVAALVHELGTYQDATFEVTLVSMVSARVRQAVLAEQGDDGAVTCTHVEADYAVEDELVALAPQTFDHVVLASSERLASGEEADTRAVVAYLLLEALLDGRGRQSQLLLELQDPDNEPLLGGRGAEVLVSPLIVAHMVAQVALRRELRAVYDELFSAGGSELVYRGPDGYGLAPGRASFVDLAGAVRRRGDTLVGIHHRAGDRLSLSPPADASVDLAADDRLVVMTTYL